MTKYLCKSGRGGQGRNGKEEERYRQLNYHRFLR